jgi:hypothetical protein
VPGVDPGGHELFVGGAGRRLAIERLVFAEVDLAVSHVGYPGPVDSTNSRRDRGRLSGDGGGLHGHDHQRDRGGRDDWPNMPAELGAHHRRSVMRRIREHLIG